MSFRTVFHFQGLLLIGLAGLMALMVLVALGLDDPAQAVRFGSSAIITGFIAGALMLGLRGDKEPVTTRRELFMMLLTGWLIVPLFAGLPMLNAGLSLSVFEAWFESLSMLTTTGISLIDPLRTAIPESVYIWRALLGWAGGMCAVVMMLVFLGPAALGGLEIAQLSFTHGEGEGVISRSRQILKVLLPIYAFVTFVGWGGIVLLGGTGVDALVLSMGAISTSGIVGPGGMAMFESAQWTVLPVGILCLFGMINMTHHARLFSGRRYAAVRTYRDDPEIGVIMVWTLAIAIVVAVAMVSFDHVGPLKAIVAGLFDAVSFISTTGYSLSPQLTLGDPVPFAAVLLLGMGMVIGGSVASTAGGVRPLRLIVLMMQGARELSRMVHERAVVRFRYRHHPVAGRVVRSISALIVLYALSGLFCAFGFALSGLSAEQSLVAALSAMVNCGPALSFLTDGAITGPQLDDGAQAIFAIGMVLGRVEVLAFLALLTPQYWRR